MTSTLTLRSNRLEAVVDPAHGAEVLALRIAGGGESLLATVPFVPAEPRAGDLDEDTWTAGYRGGWQLLTPNAGDACSVEGVDHGFHGRASNDPWELVESSPASARLVWHGHGLSVTRRLGLAGDALTAITRWEAHDRPTPMLHVEHMALGRLLLYPEVELCLPPAGGRPGRLERLTFRRPHASFAALGPLESGCVAARNRRSGLAVRLSWDVRALPFLWLWQENRDSGGVWEHRTEILGLEPASWSGTAGLASAIASGAATWVQPGRPVEREVRLEVVCHREPRRSRGVPETV